MLQQRLERPKTSSPTSSMSANGESTCPVIPMQLLAFHAAGALGLDIDKPRNLAKSVTVE